VCRAVQAMTGQQLRVVWPWSGRTESVLMMGSVSELNNEDEAMPLERKCLAWGSGSLG
jgi:hypothetical protein